MTFAEKKRLEALKKSSVKIKGNDVVASWKILVGVFLAPAVIFITTIVFHIFVSRKVAFNSLTRILTSLLFFIVLTSYLVMCVQLLNGINTNTRICLVRCWVILYKNKIKKLRADRKELKKKVKETMDLHSQKNQHDVLIKRKSTVQNRKDSNASSRGYQRGLAIKLDIEGEEIFGTLVDIVG